MISINVCLFFAIVILEILDYFLAGNSKFPSKFLLPPRNFKNIKDNYSENFVKISEKVESGVLNVSTFHLVLYFEKISKRPSLEFSKRNDASIE